MDRTPHLQALESALKAFPVVAILGARQVGKTTLARQLAARRRGPTTTFDLEQPRDLQRLSDPMLALEGLRGLVVIDEVQRRPDLFPALRVLADRRPLPARFLVLGSAAPEMLRQTSESLAGRILHYPLAGISLDEVPRSRLLRLWLRGGFPRSYLARSASDSFVWRDEFVRTFVERDAAQLGINVPATTLHRFWSMLAHYHGQIWNASEFARSFGVGDAIVRRTLDLLTGTYMVRQLPPWFENLGKRLVKSPKIYLADSGILHSLLNLAGTEALERHPKVGASWEGFAMAAVERQLGSRRGEAYFWATHAGAELDLLVVRGRRRLGFEIKRTSVPRVTKSMHVALADLSLERIDVIHAGRDTFPLAPRIRAVALSRVLDDVAPLT